ncbi:MAG: hypothetical protein SNJ59_06790 [Aggregatilineales bacterium]
MLTLFLIVVVGASFVFLVRSVLVSAGFYKDPILEHFRRYQPIETCFDPWPSVLLWMGVLLSASGFLSELHIQMGFIFILMGFSLLALGGWADMQETARRLWHQWIVLPRWYAQLRERTTREERRRIGFMWLWLPARTRARLSISDAAFQQWADLIIIATVMQTVEEAAHKASEKRTARGEFADV